MKLTRFRSWLKENDDVSSDFRENHFSWDQGDLDYEPNPAIRYEPNITEDAGKKMVRDWSNPIRHERHLESDSRGNNSGSILNHTDHLSMSQHALSFKDNHRKSIDYYKNYSPHVNGPLRTGVYRAMHGDEEGLSKHEHAPYVKDLDHVTSHVMMNNHVTFRGMTKRYDPVTLRPGDHMTDYGYTGTSHSAGIADDFSHKGPTATGEMKMRMFRIHMPAGTKAYHMDRHENDHDHEQETLLHRGTKFRIGDHHDYYGHHVVDLHVVSQGHEPPTNPVSGAKVYE